MKKRFYHRMWLKIAIRFKRMFDPRSIESITRTERDAIYIFNTLTKDPGSELYIHPSYDKYYIKSPKTGIFVTITTHHPEISIINHVYGYNVKLSIRAMNGMVKIFLKEVEKRRLHMENEYTSNIEHSINNIAKTIKERL